MATEVEEFNINPEIIIQAFDVEKTLDDFSLKDIEEFYIEYGGVTDPLGQLASTIMDFFESIASSLESTITSVIYSIESSIKGAISGVESAIMSAISGVQSTIDGVISSIESVSSNIMSALDGVVNTITSTLESVVSQIETGFSSVTSTIESLFASIQQTIESIMTSITSTLESVVSQIETGFSSVTSTIESLFASIQQTIESIMTSITSTLESVVSQIETGFSSITSTIEDLFTSVQQTIESIMTSITSTLESIVSQIETGFSSVTTAIEDLFTSVQQTIESIMTSITSTLESIVSQIETGFSSVTTAIEDLFTSVQQTIESIMTSITSTLESIVSQIETGFSSIGDLFTSVQQTIESIMTSITSTIETSFSSITTTIDWIREQVNKIPELPSLVWSYIEPYIQPLIDTVKDIPSKMAEISKAFEGFINPLVGIGQFFEQIRQKFIDFVTNIPNYFKSIADFFSNIAKDPLGWFNENVVKPLADAFSGLGEWIWEHLPDWLKNAITTAQDWFSNAVDWITKGWNDFVDWVSKIPEHIQNLGNYIYENAIKPLQDWFNENVVKPLNEAIKPLSNAFDVIEDRIREFSEDPIGAISTFLQDVWNVVRETLSNIIGGMLTFLSNLANTILNVTKDIIENIFNTTTSFLSNFANTVISTFWKTLSGLIDASKSLWKQVGNFLSDIIKSVFESIYKNVAKPVEDAVIDLIKRITHGGERGQIVETFELLGVTMVTFIGSEYLARGLQITLRKLAGIFNEYEKSFTIRVRGRGEAKGEPVGVGAGASGGGGGGFEYIMRFNIGYPLRKIADEMQKYSDEYRRGIIYGMTIWASQPMMRLASATWRNILPVELPTLAELREITRRHMPVKEKFKQHLETMGRYLALYGYNDEVIAWLTTPITEEGWFVTIIDRFGNKRRVPISLLYELPTPSDIARMMIHDLFTVPGKPEVAFQSFKTIMSMKGYYEDIAKFYYLLHYKYPSMSDLWDFSCRTVAKQTWVAVKPTKEEDLGASKVYSPVQLQNMYGLTRFTGGEVANKLNKIIQDVLRHYAKWHDYAPFGWLDNWTADNLIYLDLMADIPMRIDARWMYKWKVPIPEEISNLTGSKYFDEKALFLIITSRGMHPRWIEPITIAECMNALAEERTYARTGVINAFKEGFMLLDGLSKTLSHLTDVEILGKKVPVRFLDGEVTLLTLRAKYDRALDILRDYFRDLLRGVTENIITFDVMVDSLNNEVKAIANTLKLQNLSLDLNYYKLYHPVAESLRKVRTVERIRYWYRYMLYRILYRFSEGYMSEEEFKKVIEEITANAKLTPEEEKVFTEIAWLMYDGFYKKTLADAILHKVRRGVIDPKKAKEELVKLGLTDDLAEALIEKSVKIYTLSISTLLSYAEYVDIPEEFVKRKLEWMGVPKDEMPIILQVFRIRPLKDERAKMIRSVIDAYINGYITKELLQENLENLGKSPREVQILTEYADFEKSQAEAKLGIDAILNRLRRGAITLDDARKELKNYVVDEALIDAMIEKYVRTSVWSPDKLVSMAEYVPIDLQKLVEKAKMFGYPEDEVNLYPAYTLARNLNEEIGRVITELVYLYVYDVIDENTLSEEIDKVRTLDGKVKDYGVDWIVIDDNEKELIIKRAKFRKMREQAEEQAES